MKWTTILILLTGCGVKQVETVEYCATYYLYDSKIQLQAARGTLRSIKGFHQSHDGKYEVHVMKWDLETLGHEVMHGLIKEGVDDEGHPHF